MAVSNKKDRICTVCGTELARKGDMPRHMRTHSDDKDSMLYRCPVDGCEYANLQKSNVDTHIRTHTQERSHQCPDCIFSAVDPGSLTRHRKRKHGYIPKKRKCRKPASAAVSKPSKVDSSESKDDGDDNDASPPAPTSTRASRRHHPYRASSQSAQLPSSSSESTP